MATREDFRLHADLYFEPDNPAVESILRVVDDQFGKGSVRAEADEQERRWVRVRIDSAGVDARTVNYLHQCLARLAKYLLEPADVDCSDSTGRERAYRLEPAASGTPAPATDGAVEDGGANTADDEAGGQAAPAVG